MENGNSNSSIPPSPESSETIRPEQYNMRNPSVKRIMAEARELALSTEEFVAQPLEENIFEWHFTFRGPPDSDFAVGVYHGRIILPKDYPMNPPAFIMLTPNGRFEIGKKICLSISSYHPETWRPCWSIRTAITALLAFMTQSSPGAIGSLECTSEQRQAFARKSLAYQCPQCGPCATMITYTRKSSPEMTPRRHSIAPRLFRMPNSARQVTDAVIPPEDIIGRRPPLRRPLDDQLGDIGDVPVDDGMAWQFGGEILPRINGPIPDNQIGNATFGITVGFLCFCIAGIVFRRFGGDASWAEIFGFE